MNFFALSHYYENKGKIGCYIQTNQSRESLTDACMAIWYAAEDWVIDGGHVWTSFYFHALPLVGFDCEVSLDLKEDDYEKIDLYDVWEGYAQNRKYFELHERYKSNAELETLIKSNIHGQGHIFVEEELPVRPV